RGRRGTGPGSVGVDRPTVPYRVAVAAAVAAFGRPGPGGAAPSSGRATASDPAAASNPRVGHVEAMAGGAAGLGAGQVGPGQGDRLCLEQLGRVATLLGTGLPEPRQQS